MKNGKWEWVAKKGHKLRRGTRRVVPESYCDTKSCKFYGKPAAQGICYSRIDDGFERHFKFMEKRTEDFLKEVKKTYPKNVKCPSPQKWADYLESQLFCAWMNYDACLEEVIYLRAENAKLRLAAGKWKGRR